MPSFTRAAGVIPGGSWRLPVLVVTRAAWQLPMRPLPDLVTTLMMIKQIKTSPPTNSPASSPNYAMLGRKATMDNSSSDPPLEQPSTTVTAALTQAEVDMEYVRSLERQFAAHAHLALEEDLSRLSPRRARK